MSDKSKPSIIRYVFRISIMIFTLLMLVIPVVESTNSKYVDCNSYVMDSGWYIKVRDVEEDGITLSKHSFPICNKGDTLVLEKVIPAEAEGINNPILNFYSVHSTVDVYINSELQYTYGWDYYNNGELLGYGDHYIDLPEDYVGKTITILLTVTEDNAFDGIQAISISDARTMWVKELSGRRVNLFISCFLLMFGSIIMILSVIMLRKNSDFVQTFCIAMFSFLAACWTLCNSDLITFLTTNLRVKVYMEYMTMYLLPVPVTYYFKDKVYEKGSPFFIKMIFWAFVGVAVALAATAYICQRLNLVHYPYFLPMFHILLLVDIVFIIMVNVADIIRKRRKGIRQINPIMIGILIAFSLVFFELFRFNFGKFFAGFEGNEYNSTVCFAVLIVVISLLTDYGQSISKSLYANAKSQFLETMAYADELTGLANRRRCEDTLEAYKEQRRIYSIISFDLNFLKKVNDTEGHDKGDAMLKKFADVLLEIFDEVGLIGRMGGDEFMVVLPDKSIKETEKLVNLLLKLMDQKNLSDKDIVLSTAYGIASSTEVDLSEDAHAAYRLADERMYKNKRKSNHGRT